MKIKDLIERLEDLHEGHGNLEVKLVDANWSYDYSAVDGAYLGCDYDKDKNPIEYYFYIE